MDRSWLKNKKRWLLVLAAVVLVVGGIRAVSGGKNGYVVGQVEKKTLTETVSESGTVTAGGLASVYSSTNGIVDEVYVSNGQVVLEKQNLFSVKSTATPQEKTEAFALYQAAKTAVQQAENTRLATTATVNRVHDDLKNKDKTETFTEKETRVTAEVTNDNAYDALLAARANLASTQAKYSALLSSTAVAPVAGTIVNLAVTSGSSIAVKNLLTASVPALLIKVESPTEIAIAVGESDINKIKTGQKATIKLDAVENTRYDGLVQRYDESGTLVQGVVKYNVYVTVTNPDNNIKPGMTADVDIITKELTGVLAVPNAAIKPYQKGRAVRYLDRQNQLQYQPIKIGVRGKDYTQIIEGLNEGQTIVISLSNEKTTRAGFFPM